MFHRFHRGGRKSAQASGKWQRLSRSGVGFVHSESDGKWGIRVTHRLSGTVIRRDVYQVTIRAESTGHEEYLSGFSSKTTALAAARRRVQMLKALHRRARIRQIG